MPTNTRSFALVEGGEQRLQLTWEVPWKSVTISNTSVSVDGQQVGVIATHAELVAGREFQLADGAALSIRWGADRRAGIGWVVHYNGQPVPDSAADPGARVRAALRAAFIVAAINLLIGAAGVLGVIPVGRTGGVTSIVYGALMIGLGLWARRGAAFGLIGASALQLIDLASYLVAAGSLGFSGSALVNLVVKGYFLVQMVRGVPALLARGRAARGGARAQPPR